MLVAGFALGMTHARPARSVGTIYSCIGKKGEKITQDHPIAECADKDQIEHNLDGSPKRIVPRQETEEERAAREARERTEAAERTQRQVEARADRQLLNLYPDKTAHDAARVKALDEVRRNIRNSEERKKLLLVERKPLLDEAEFYVGKPLPLKLKLALDSNDAALAGQELARQNQETELARINKNFDEQLDKLRKLWAAPPGPQRAKP